MDLDIHSANLRGVFSNMQRIQQNPTYDQAGSCSHELECGRTVDAISVNQIYSSRTRTEESLVPLGPCRGLV